jgi:hypothetical protein
MRPWKLLLPLLASTLCFAAQPDRIPGAIDSSQMVALPRSVHPKAQPRYDQGSVDPSLQFGYVTLAVAPSPSQQAAIDQLLAQQQDRFSPNYHKWLTPEQYADRFGMSQNDLNKITAWLKSQGFTVLSVPRGRNSVIFSGTAAQIQSAFNTEIHRYNINGEPQIANSVPVSIPAALNGVVTGIRGLTSFHPKPMYVRPVRSGKTRGPHPSYTTTIDGSTEYILAPGDIATIYDLNPLYNATTPIDGTGQKLAIIGQTDVYLADINDFRSGFGLSQISGCTTNASGIVTACDSTNFQYVVVAGVTDPGTPSTCGDLVESDLDIEWSGAVARNAQIIFVNAPATFNSDCTNIMNNGGVNSALVYAIENTTAPVISMSYGICEADAESLETELQQGNMEGITIMNSAGDTGAAGCDNDPPDNEINPPFSPAIGGLAVNYPASSQYVTGVGGTSVPSTEFTPTYWGASNGTNGGSALQYTPEVSWNDDVAFAQFCQSDPSNEFCTEGGPPPVSGWVDLTSAEAAQQDIWISIGSGGVSNCYNETAGGICESGFPKPTWQQAITIPGLTSPQSTYRFVPDVSLIASPNYPGYVFCTPLDQWVSGNPSTASTCASGIATGVDTYFSIVGGTSASSPVFAGIVTLLNQYLGSSGLSNINPTLYALAATPSNGAFHQITSGDSDVYCQEGTPAGQPPDVICPSTTGIIGFSASNADSTTGYNLVTGLGSVDANKLAIAWAESLAPPATFTLQTASNLSPSSISAGQSATATLTLTLTSGTSATINFTNSTSSPTSSTPGSCTAGLPPGALCTFSNPGDPSSPTSFTLTTANPTATVGLTITTQANMAIPTGVQSITVTGTASGTGGTTQTATVNLTVTANCVGTVCTQSFTITPASATYSVNAGGAASVAITVAGTGGFINTTTTPPTTALPLTYTCTQSSLPSEASCSFSPTSGNSVSATSVTLTISTTAPTTQLRPPLGRASRIFYALLLPGLFGIVFATGSRTRVARLLTLIVVLGFSTLWLGACSGGSNSSQNNPGTPAGSYSVVVNATTGGAVPLTNSFTVTLTVN